MNDVAAPTARIRAFAWDYVVVLGYLVALTGLGLLLTFGPVGPAWMELMEDPVRADFVAFVLAVLPVVLYFALSEGSETGATRGKRRVGLVAVYLVGLTRLGGYRPMYDRVAGTVVVRRRAAV